MATPAASEAAPAAGPAGVPDAAPAAVRRPKSEKTFLWRAIAVLVIPFLGLVSKITVLGVEKVPATGAFVLAPNHFSEIDPLVVSLGMWKAGRMPRFLAKASLFKVPVLRAILRWTKQIPVERAGVTRGSDPLATARTIVDHGLAVIIYPEGSLTRDPDYWPMRGKSGAVRMALDADIPLIPAVHWGTQLVLPRYGKLSLFPRKKVTMIFGDPVDLTGYRGRQVDSAALAKATDLLMHDMTALLEGLRGETAPIERWDPLEHNQTEIGKA